jgi:3-oxoacyl-[acyl-carrier protein] reductase
MELRNATALVTGGSSGIGFAIAKTLIDAGVKVAITGRDEKRLADAAQSLKALPIRGDVGNEGDVLRTYQEVLKAFGHLDILVNNAGKGVFKPLLDMSKADYESVLTTNMTGAMMMAREAAKHFVTRKSGNIVNIGSTASHRGAPNGTAYYASKAALRIMTEVWRAELRQHNIRVMLVNPSEVLTGFAAAAGFEQKVNPSKLRGEEIAHAVKAVLEMDDRGFTTELTVFATNPKD